jgi:tetratricopeptide (TPR) repeat protein
MFVSEAANHYAAVGADAIREGKYDKAEHYLYMALDEDPRCVNAHTNLCALYGLLGRKQEALQASLNALQYDPGNVVVLFNVGTAFMEMGDHQQAAVYLKKAALQDPKYSLAVFNLAMCYDQTGQLDDALLWYQRAADLNPGDPDPIYNMAEVYFRMRDLARAEMLCRRALDLFDTQFENTQVVPYLPDGETYSREQLLAEIAYKNAMASALMAWIQANQGKLQAALASIKQATEIYPQVARWFLLMGELYSKLGNGMEAQRAWARARALDPNIFSS